MRNADMRARWVLLYSLVFTIFALGTFAYLFVVTTHNERARIDDSILRDLAFVAGAPPRELSVRVHDVLAADEHRTRFAAVFDARGRRLAGNVLHLPTAASRDGAIFQFEGIRDNERGRKVEDMRVALRHLPGGRTVLIGNDLDALDQSRHDLFMAIAAGALPALCVALGLGLTLGVASQQRVRRIESALDRIVAGDFSGRLPVANGSGEVDRIAFGVNRMLEAIETLLDEVRGVGDDMAHDLRTPLGRVRAQLERSRGSARTSDELRMAIDRAIGGLDQALTVIVAILRIGEIEHRARRSGFANVDLAEIVREVVELYAPIAEDAGVELAAVATVAVPVDGDRALLFEALANLTDNAIKFAASGGQVSVRACRDRGRAMLVVRDDGPGIAPEDRAAMLKRFVRADKSRHVAGNGLGLSLVAAIARLHDCALTIEAGSPGCVVTLAFAGAELTHGGRAAPAQLAPR